MLRIRRGGMIATLQGCYGHKKKAPVAQGFKFCLVQVPELAQQDAV
jgi:hypothetical protein